MSNVITITNDNETYKIITKFAEDDSFEVTVLNGRNSYFSKVLRADIETFSTKFEMNFNEYFDSLRLYLSNVHPHIGINIVNNELIVYKNMKVKYFYTAVEKSDYNWTTENIIEALALEGSDLENSCANLEKSIEKNQTSSDFFDTKFRDLAIEFEAYQIEYHSDFCKLVNSKKRQIQFLMDVLEGKDIDNKEAKIHKIENNLSDSEDENDTTTTNHTINIDNRIDSKVMDVDVLSNEEHSESEMVCEDDEIPNDSEPHSAIV